MTRPKVLIIDDEPNVLHALRRLLRKENYDVVTTTNPHEGLEWVRTDTFAVVISDQRMPEMPGSHLLAQVRTLSPDTVRIILTGYADMQATIEAINQGAVYRFLNKPWHDDDLRETLRQAIGQYQLVEENKRLQAIIQAQNEQLRTFNKSLNQKVFERTRQATQLTQKLDQSVRSTLDLILRITEIHSPTLSKHARRVEVLALQIGDTLKLSEERLFHLSTAALLHDIGKLGMAPESIDQPPGKLSPKDRAVYMTHAMKGAGLIETIPNLELTTQFIRHQLERFDGTGVPDQLKGEAIPLESRILAVADAYDTALYLRAGFMAISPEHAMQYVEGRSSTHFDPAIVTILHRQVLGHMPRPSPVMPPLQPVMSANEEVAINLRELRPGQMLARNVVTQRGVVLLPHDTWVEPNILVKLRRHHQFDPIVSGLYVYRNPPKRYPEEEKTVEEARAEES